VCAHREHLFDAMIDRRINHVASSENVGQDGFEWIIFARRHLLESSGVNHDIDIFESSLQAVTITNVAHEVTERRSSRIRKPVPHLALLQLVAAEDNKPPWGKLPHQDLCEFVSEGTRASRNQDRSIAPIHAILRIFSSPATLAVSPSGWCQE